MVTGNLNFIILEDYEFLEFFESEAVDSSIDDGYWCYQYKDKNELTIKFSFNIFEKSIQTQIFLLGKSIITSSYEGDCKMKLENNVLICEFIETGRKTILSIKLMDGIKVDWSSIKI